MENEIKNSIAYLHKKTGIKTGFSTPSDYFNTLEEAIVTNLLEENCTKKSGFEIPDTYFNNLENTILAKVSSKEKETKVISFKERILKMIPIAAAASIVLFIGLNSFVFNSNKETTLDALSDNDIEFWLDSNTITISEAALALDGDDLLLEENDFSFSTIKDDAIEDYINNSIDNTDLLNEIN